MSLLHALVHHRFWVALMVLSLGVFGSLSLRIPVDPRALTVLYLSTFIVYNIDHVRDLTGTGARVALGLSVVAALLLLAFLSTLPPSVGALAGSGLIAICGYLFVPHQNGQPRRHTAWSKPAFVGAAVGTAVVLVPLELARSEGRITWSAALTREVLARGVVLSLLCAANALFCDALDESTDRVDGHSTPAVVHGRAVAERVATSLAVGAALLAAAAYASGWTRAFDARWSTISAALSTALIARLLPRSTPRHTSVFLMDGALMVPAAVTLWVSR